MNIILDILNTKLDNIYIINPIKNRLINNSLFYKIFYSNNFFILNSLYIKIPISYYNIKLINDKLCYDFNVEKNRKTISYIESLEEYILNKLIPKNNVKKIYKKNCSQQLKKGFIYITKDNEPDNFNTSYTDKLKRPTSRDNIVELIGNNTFMYNNDNNENSIILKISGIWETSEECGLSFKYLNYTNEYNIKNKLAL